MRSSDKQHHAGKQKAAQPYRQINTTCDRIKNAKKAVLVLPSDSALCQWEQNTVIATELYPNHIAIYITAGPLISLTLLPMVNLDQLTADIIENIQYLTSKVSNKKRLEALLLYSNISETPGEHPCAQLKNRIKTQYPNAAMPDAIPCCTYIFIGCSDKTIYPFINKNTRPFHHAFADRAMQENQTYNPYHDGRKSIYPALEYALTNDNTQPNPAQIHDENGWCAHNEPETRDYPLIEKYIQPIEQGTESTLITRFGSIDRKQLSLAEQIKFSMTALLIPAYFSHELSESKTIFLAVKKVLSTLGPVKIKLNVNSSGNNQCQPCLNKDEKEEEKAGDSNQDEKEEEGSECPSQDNDTPSTRFKGEKKLCSEHEKQQIKRIVANDSSPLNRDEYKWFILYKKLEVNSSSTDKLLSHTETEAITHDPKKRLLKGKKWKVLRDRIEHYLYEQYIKGEGIKPSQAKKKHSSTTNHETRIDIAGPTIKLTPTEAAFIKRRGLLRAERKKNHTQSTQAESAITTPSLT